MAPASTWGVGDYPLMAERLLPAAELAVEAVGVTSEDRVLDVACGTGNAAFAAARRGASVVGVDSEPALVEIARHRAAELGLEARWREADMLDADAIGNGFSVVLSIFGVMYASDHEAAVAGLARAGSPGARVGLTAWTPGSVMPAMGAALAPFLPPPPAGSGPPSRWGDRAALGELLSGGGLALRDASTERLELDFASQESAVDFLVRTAGHVVHEQRELERQGRWQDMLAALGDVVADRAVERDGGVVIEFEYLLSVLGVVPGE